MGIPTPVPPSDEQKSALVERIIRGELTPEQAQERHGLSRAELKDWVRIYRREARRAFDDRVKTVLSNQGIDIADLTAAEFSGNVEDMSVAELLQTVQLGGKDAEIQIEDNREVSRIWCIAGQVVDALTGELTGAPAMYRLLAFERGRIHADFSPVQHARTIQVSTQALLMEGARRFDECNQLRGRLDDTTAVFVPSDRSLAPDVRATPEQFAVLRLFDGVRSVEDVVRVSACGDLETLGSIVSLMDMGLLERVRSSHTSLREAIVPVHAIESSFLPTAASVGVPPLARRPARRWVWGVAAVGAATLGAALAIRFSEQERAQRAEERGTATAAPPAQLPQPVQPAAPALPSVAPAVVPAQAAVRAAPPTAAFPLCPEGSVLVGRAAPPPGAPPGAQPAVEAYCMGRAEVSVADYERCRERGDCDAVSRDGEPPAAGLSVDQRQRAKRVYDSQCNVGQPGRERHPINCVTFRQASAYCAAAGGRLPTEEEWELAARGLDGRRFPWGDAPPGPSRLNACGLECKGWYAAAQLDGAFGGVMYEGDDGFAGTAPVASFPAGATSDGIFDLLGNVAEWTSTAVDFGAAAPASGAPHAYVVRGGSFSSGVDGESAPALRLYLDAEAHGRGVGFRCAFSPQNVP